MIRFENLKMLMVSKQIQILIIGFFLYQPSHCQQIRTCSKIRDINKKCFSLSNRISIYYPPAKNRGYFLIKVYEKHTVVKLRSKGNCVLNLITEIKIHTICSFTIKVIGEFRRLYLIHFGITT